jgi:hypothetical protein
MNLMQMEQKEINDEINEYIRLIQDGSVGD